MSHSYLSTTTSPQKSDRVSDIVSFVTAKQKKPKRNRSAFILFSMDVQNKPHFEEKLINLNSNDRFTMVAQLWKEVSKEDRKIYEERAQQERAKYTSDLSSFCEMFPTSVLQKSRNRTKRPCNAYGYYLKEMKDMIKDEDPNLRMCDIVRIVAERWRNLEPAQKTKYQDRARENQRVYQTEIKKQAETPVKKMKLTNDMEKTIIHKEKRRETEEYSGSDNLSCEDPIFSSELLPKIEENIYQGQTKNEDVFSQNLVEVQKTNMLGLLDMYNKVEVLRQMIIGQIKETATTSALAQYKNPSLIFSDTLKNFKIEGL